MLTANRTAEYSLLLLVLLSTVLLHHAEYLVERILDTERVCIEDTSTTSAWILSATVLVTANTTSTILHTTTTSREVAALLLLLAMQCGVLYYLHVQYTACSV